MWLHTALVATAAVMALPVNAFAATAKLDASGFLRYRAAPGEANDVQISAAPETVTVTDQGTVIVAGEGCTQLDDHQVRCSPALAYAYFVLGDLADNAELVDVSGGPNIEILGSTGPDRLSTCADCGATLKGGPGDDVLQVGRGGELWGRRGDDVITGGWHDDRIFDGSGDDTIASGDGDDYLIAGGGGDTWDAGDGRDLLILQRSPRSVVVDLRARTLTGYGPTTFTGVEDVEGTDFADRLYGTSGANWFVGWGGDDLLVGRAGRDSLIGASGDDHLRGGFGRDRLFGFTGADRLRGGFGRDALHGDQGDDRLRGDAQHDRLGGGRGDDLLVGGLDDDNLFGGAGNDRIFGSSGPDTLHARDGKRDLVAGGRDADRARVDPGLDVVRAVELLF
jgi:Ca2+-binding RTX toxin-like protein